MKGLWQLSAKIMREKSNKRDVRSSSWSDERLGCGRGGGWGGVLVWVQGRNFVTEVREKGKKDTGGRGLESITSG